MPNDPGPEDIPAPRGSARVAAFGASIPARQKRVDGDAIFETVRRRISTNVYPAGMALKETDLAGEFGVSRTPIRQVLQRLEYAGLVQPVVGHGTIVTGVDLDMMREVLQFRIKLSQMLESFLDLTDVEATLARLDAQRERQARLAVKFDPILFAEISHEIRASIGDHISNRYMAETWMNSYFIASRFWFTGFSTARERFTELQGEELETIHAAFRTQDPKALGQAVHSTLTIWVKAMFDALRLF